MVTKKQIKANKKNAKLSTGPKSKAGKVISAQNSIKHGILSQYVVLPDEDEDEYKSIKTYFWNDLNPVGAVEEMLVERIVNCYWKMQRVSLAEFGAVKKQSEKGFFDRMREHAKQGNSYMKHSLLYSYKLDKLFNSVSAKKVISRLKEMRKTLKEIGYLHEDQREEYLEICNVLENESDAKGFFFFCQLAEGKIAEEENGQEKGKKALLYILNKEIEEAERMAEIMKSVEEEVEAANRMTDMLPDVDTIDKLGRYETSLERSMYQALAMLTKLREIKPVV